MAAISTRMVLATALVVAAVTQTLAGCDACTTRRLRRVGSTCGQDSECAGGLCYRGRCTKSCSSNGDCAGGICIESICQQPDEDFDGDGLTNAVELKIGANPAKADSDGDGIDDKSEYGKGSTAKDSNGDGIPDIVQSNTADADGDCMVDALDVGPGDAKLANLPSADKYCFVGLCADHLKDVQVVCRKEAPTYAEVVLGCSGCGCALDPKVAPAFEPAEVTCDGIDNDCDGLVDEDQVFDGKLLGAACKGIYGICALPDANGVVPAGKVECGSDGKATCSVHGTGSQSVGKPEACNATDDDCDGATDEGFVWKPGSQSLPPGAPCDCGGTVWTCEDGKPAQESSVQCLGDGSAASCNLLPFAKSPTTVDAGAPQPRLRWSAVAPPGWGKLVLAPGAEPGVTAMVPRAQLWTMALQPEPAPWTPWLQAPSPRDGAALVVDAAADRILLVGGAGGGEPGKVVWALNKVGALTDLSDTAVASGRLLPLPDSHANKATRAWIVGAGDARRLVVFVDGQTPLWAPLAGTSPAWVPVNVPAAPPGTTGLAAGLSCLTGDDGAGAVAIGITPAAAGTSPGVLRLAAQGATVTATWLVQTGPVPARQGLSCALAADQGLFAMGGHALGGATSAGLWRATASTGWATAASLTWQELAAPDAETGARSDAALVATTAGVVAIGGHQVWLDGSGIRQRRAVASVMRLPATTTGTRLDRPHPGARIGAATGLAPTLGLCQVGGVTFGLPDVGAAGARVHPTPDAWCFAESTGWKQVAKDLPAWAFGIGGIDRATGRVLLAGGVDWTQTDQLTNLGRVWQAALSWSAAAPPSERPRASADVHLLELSTGKINKVAAPGPEQVLPSVAYDARRRRIIAFGGWNDALPTDALWSYHFETGQWSDLAKDYPVGKNRPLPGYGNIIAYASDRDVLLLVGGIMYNDVAKGAPALAAQHPENPKPEDGPPVVWELDPCRGDNLTLVWTVPTLSTPAFRAIGVPTWGGLDGPNPWPLLRLEGGRPALLPAIFDSIGGYGMFASQDIHPGESDGKGNACPQPPDLSALAAPIRLHLSLGACGSLPRVFVHADDVPALPPALVLAASVHDDATRATWIIPGVARDGGLASGLYRIDQTCQPPPPP